MWFRADIGQEEFNQPEYLLTLSFDTPSLCQGLDEYLFLPTFIMRDPLNRNSNLIYFLV